MIALLAETSNHTLLDDCRAPTARPPADWALNDCRTPVLATAPLAAPGGLCPHPQLQLLELDAAHVVAFVPSASQVAVLDHEAAALLEQLAHGPPPDDPRTHSTLAALQRLGLLTDGTDLLTPLDESPALAAWLHVTNACNLRCSYCYISKSREAMNPQVGLAAVDTVLRSARQHGYRAVALKYAGGEPALAIDLVEQMHLHTLRRAAPLGIEVYGGLLSNGTLLTPSVLSRVQKLGLGLMISLDGLAAAHDRQRATLGGGPSSGQALRGIERALDAGLTPDIAVTVTAQNVGDVPELIGWLLDRELRFTLSFYRDHHAASAAQLQLDDQRLIDGMRAAYAVVARHPPRWSLLGSLLDRADLSQRHSHACAAGGHYLVIDHQGRIAKCQMAMEQPSASVADADPLTLLRNDPRGLQRVPVDQKAGCRSCEWRYWCAGGCPVATYRATGRYDLQSPYCRVYKTLYPDLVRLEGQRILFWSSGDSHSR